jgi:rod shape determining protein RodA
MYSVGFDHGTRFVTHARNLALALVVLFVVAQIPPQQLMALAVPVYAAGVALLLATAMWGVTKKGATRWLDFGGLVIQPSEILKIAVPLMLAWWFQKRENHLRGKDFAVAALILAVPVALVIKQPDLGTGLLILAAGMYVLFFAGLSWWFILPLLALAGVGALALVIFEPTLCEPGTQWPLLREYQRNRVCTLLDPSRDPLGKGFHIIQGMIAIGAGGLTGRGFMAGTQTHLEFIPERTTDFIFAAFSEEFGLLGVLVLMACFIFLIVRSLIIASDAPTVFTRLLTGSIALSFFTYAFVNIGMVSGILPVVGVPLPFISYGGTAMVTLGLALGILMSVSRSRRMMQS